jgi:hypothetical protein
LILATATVLAGCASAELGSREDLSRRIDDLPVPDSMLALDDFYTSDCEVVCPSIVRWYDIDGSLEEARDDLLAEFERAGLNPEVNSVTSEVMTMRHEGHMYFIVIGKQLRGSNSMIPSYVDADISVSPMPDILSDATD